MNAPVTLNDEQTQLIIGTLRSMAKDALVLDTDQEDLLYDYEADKDVEERVEDELGAIADWGILRACIEVMTPEQLEHVKQMAPCFARTELLEMTEIEDEEDPEAE